jgi:methyl-accepting chemotaxis protein
MIANAKVADQVMTELDEAGDALDVLLAKVEGLAGDEMDIAKASGESAKATATWSLITIVVGSVVAGLLIGIFLTRSITKVLNRIVESLSQGSEQVTSAAGQVSSASQSLAEGSTEQAAGLEETSSSLEEMASMTKQNADNAQQANTLASEARKAADTGTEAMQRMSTAINDIQKSSDETAKIIKVIDEIAFQTNLLALNAAVEAARAGEAGKGFAVVAEEVRNLAMRSAEAAKNTSAMIEESVKNSKNGVDIAAEVGKVLEEIVQGIGKTTDLVGEIAAASQEQSQGIDQVNTAVAQMDKVTQQNAANAEESASASEELSAQAESMNDVVGDLMALVGGSAAQRSTSGKKSSGHHLNVNVDHGAAQKAHEALSQTKQHGFGKSDQAFHKIANGQAKRQRVAQPATAVEKTIPLKGDKNADSDDFKEFNG